ncbi:unnamed protein product [Brachionus calyciflorus]|uniref:Uncharacterized protein n=1 Tax=Brachionus calyciflorus TaxID=104777 RepID=A0A814MJI0_9BILA|nr:unnamed protein product [Brachionus calyciflorus]
MIDLLFIFGAKINKGVDDSHFHSVKTIGFRWSSLSWVSEDGALDLDDALDLDGAIDFVDAKDGALEIDDAKDGGLKFDDALDFDETDVTTLVLMVAGVGALKFFVD